MGHSLITFVVVNMWHTVVLEIDGVELTVVFSQKFSC